MGSKERHWRLELSGCPASSKVVLRLSEPPSLRVQRESEHLPATYSPGPFMGKSNVPKQVSALSGCALGFSSGPEKAQPPPRHRHLARRQSDICKAQLSQEMSLAK